MEHNELPVPAELQIDTVSAVYLRETARWGKFLSILCFIYCGLLLLVALFFGAIMSKTINDMGTVNPMAAMMGGPFFGAFLIIIALILFFPGLYLFNFSSKLRQALDNNNQAVLTESLKNLKSLFKFYGVFTLIIISIYALAFIAGIFGMMAGRH